MRTLRRLALALTLAGPAVFTACRSSNAYDVANSQTGDVMLVSSGPLLVGPGRTVKFTITPALAQSHADVSG